MRRMTIVTYVVIVLVGAVALMLGSWWWLAVVALLTGLAMRVRLPGVLFWPGLAAGFTLWGIGALWFSTGGGTLPAAMADVFGLGSGLVLGLLVALVGGITAGLFTLAGAYLRMVVQGPLVP